MATRLPIADCSLVRAVSRRDQRKAVDTPPGLKPRGFSVRPRSYRRESPKGLPGPLDIPGRVLVPIENKPAGHTDMGAHAQALGHARSTARTVLGGIGGWHGDDPTPGAC